MTIRLKVVFQSVFQTEIVLEINVIYQKLINSIQITPALRPSLPEKITAATVTFPLSLHIAQ